MADTKPHNNANGVIRLFGMVAGVLAIIAGVYAMTEPMGQRIDFLERQLNSMTSAMATDDKREIQDIRERGALAEKFTEVETQFSDVERRIECYEKWHERWEDIYPALEATQNEKIKQLERIVLAGKVSD